MQEISKEIDTFVTEYAWTPEYDEKVKLDMEKKINGFLSKLEGKYICEVTWGENSKIYVAVKKEEV